MWCYFFYRERETRDSVLRPSEENAGNFYKTKVKNQRGTNRAATVLGDMTTTINTVRGPGISLGGQI